MYFYKVDRTRFDWLVNVGGRDVVIGSKVGQIGESRNILKSDRQKVPDLSHFGPLLPTWELNLT